jgi:hypothetical protein
MQAAGLPYTPGTTWSPKGRIVIHRGLFFLGLTPMPLTITFEYVIHGSQQGLVVYHFCVDSPVLEVLLASVAIAILAYLILRFLFPDLEEKIPVPPQLPEPLPNPFPIPAPGERVPVPRLKDIFNKLEGYLSSISDHSTSSVSLQQQALTGSVGRGARNSKGDVQIVQLMLNAWQGFTGQRKLALDGLAGPLTCGAIASLQQAANFRVSDGRVDPGGPTLSVLGPLTLMSLEQSYRSTPRFYDPDLLAEPESGLDPMSVFWSSLRRG